ncbi:MAG: METTL5 family protein [Thermoplasmata archaeon]
MKIKNKKDLSIILSDIEGFSEHKILLEQYATPPEIASDILLTAFNDIENKTVADLGCGSGTFAIGASILGAKKVYCVEIDKDAIEIAQRNCEKLGLEIEFLNMDVKEFQYNVDTIIENPPFGYQLRGADSIFIEKSLERSRLFYMLQNSRARAHVIKMIKDKGVLIMEKNYKLSLPYTFKFHKKPVKEMDVILFVVKVVYKNG